MSDRKDADAWREIKEAHLAGVKITLPSGLPVRIRPVGFDLLATLGAIPDALTPVIGRIMAGQFSEEDQDDLLPTSSEEIAQFVGVTDAFCKACLVWPRIVDGPLDELGDDEITLEVLGYADKLFLFQFVNQPVAALEFFRDEQAGTMDIVDTKPGDEQESGGDSKSEPVGKAKVATS